MRILQVHAAYRIPGGEDAVVAAERELLRSGGHDVTVHEVANPTGTLETLRGLARAPWNAEAARAVRSAVRREHPDVVHVHNTWFALSPAVVAAAHGEGAAVVATLHNYRLLCVQAELFRDGGPCEDCVGRSPLPGVVHACYRGSRPQSAVVAATLALHRRRGTWTDDVDALVATTDFARDRFVAGGLERDKIVVVPHAVADPGPRRAPPSSSDEILLLGRVTQAKGADVVLAASDVLRRHGLVLALAGHVEAADELRARHPGVRVLGPLPRGQALERLQRARALVFPSRTYETFGLVLVEAMAAGTPVVASDRGGTPEVLGSGPGRLVAPGDVSAWRAALETLADGAAVDVAGAAGRQRWADTFSPSVGRRRLEEVYATARAARRRPSRRRVQTGPPHHPQDPGEPPARAAAPATAAGSDDA